MKQIQKITKLFLFISMALNAGDPCPIHFKFYDAGVPSWLDKQQVLSTLKSKSFWLGISYASKSTHKGFKISKVYKDSPADKAGIKMGDYITKIDNISIKNKDDTNIIFDTALKTKNLNDSMIFTVLRDGKHQNIPLVLNKIRDPLIPKLKKQLIQDREYDTSYNCTHVTSDVLVGEKRKKVYAEVFINGRSFDCKNAHKKISALKLKLFNKWDTGNVVVVRGSRRILFAHLGWKTICVNYDGDLTQSQRKQVLSDLFDDYIEDRHKNP